MSRRVQDALREASGLLSGAGIADAPRDSRILLAHVLGTDPGRIPLMADQDLTPDQNSRFAAAIAARQQRQPVSQIIGRRAFWGREFQVSRHTLDPRPDTETLIEHALKHPFSRVLDLGTGTGCILLTCLAERAGTTGLGTDISDDALMVARANSQRLGLDARADFIQSDWWKQVSGQFDLILSNPPYIAQHEMAGLAPEVRDWEPHLALSPGGDGLGAYREIAKGVMDHLAPGGRILVEVGPTQGKDVLSLFAEIGLTNGLVHQDIDGRDRVVAANHLNSA